MKKILIITLSCMLLMAQFNCLSFSADKSQSQLAVDEGKAYGAQMGTMDGARDAEKDFDKGLPMDSKRNQMIDSAIYSKYTAPGESGQFKYAFIVEYRASYVNSYDMRYRELMYTPFVNTSDRAKGDGEQMGLLYGASAATKDFVDGVSNDSGRALLRFTNEKSIESRFFLNREDAVYARVFVQQFKIEFERAYSDFYRDLNLKYETYNLNKVEVAMNEVTLEYKAMKNHFVDGAYTEENNTPAWMVFKNATVYEPIQIALYKLQDSFNMKNTSNLTPVSSVFQVSVENSGGSCAFRKPVALTFEYYGSEYAGIYQLINGVWIYQTSYLEDGKITTYIRDGYYKGGMYAVFIDEAAVKISYNRFHWAKDEIYTLARRGVLSADEALKPTKTMTRIEFAKLLYQLLEGKKYTQNLEYAAMEYVIDNGYMYKDKVGQFSRYSPLTYADFEAAMSAYLKYNIEWRSISEKLLREKFVRSNYNNDRTNTMPRDEVYYGVINILR